MKLVAFTFDDGPGPHTAALLDGLLLRDAKATFFVLTNHLDAAKSGLIRRMHEEGHEVANHTASHSRLHHLATDEIRREITAADNALRGITGKTPALFRPPYGGFTTRVMGAVGKPFILWSVNTKDWCDFSHGLVLNAILADISDGDIILLHEHEGSHSMTAAFEAMDILASQGYRFVTVPELFAARGISPESGSFYCAANSKSCERNVFDGDDSFAQ
ncbi:MAG: polysaccharide deacetylase family protein [Oscillospiraceae bacterium]|nr:polysaccharide deacetylase family protein [Oscillospiraceae bacterium]